MAVDVPFMDESVSTNPSEAPRDALYLIGGSAILIGSLMAGSYVVNRVKSTAGDALGVDMSDSDDGGILV